MTKMFNIQVFMYGLPPQVTNLRQIEIEIPEGSGMSVVLAEMRKAIPSLEGPVIRKGENRLVDLFKFNINGQFYFDGMDFKLFPGDRIALLVPATGG